MTGSITSARQPKLVPAELDADQRALYDSIASGPRAQGQQLFSLTDPTGALEGPFNAMLLSPPIGAALQALGSAVRYRSSLANRTREIAILVVGHHSRSDFEIYAHEPVARAAGLDASDLDALREQRFDVLTDDQERLVARTTYALATQGDLNDAEYAAASEALGPKALFELTTLVGYYATLALQLRVYRVITPIDESA